MTRQDSDQETPWRDIPVRFEQTADGIEVEIGEGDTVARTMLSEDDAKLAITRLIDELGAWGEFDAP